ncbi:MAG: TatD family hydrolase [Myxococcota bacterium]
MIDAHCHLDLPAFRGQVSQALERASKAGVEAAIIAGVDPEGWDRQRELAAAHPNLHVTFGIHPWAVAKLDDEGLDAALGALDMALRPTDGVHPVGLGELGLDRGRRVPKDSVPRQIRAFRHQLALARACDLPVVLHVVKAHGLALELAKADNLPTAGAMVHAFSGSPEVATEWVRLGAHVSFSTAIARPQSRRLRAACRVIPSDRLLAETDSPDQSADPSGHGHNEPAHLPLAISAIAASRGVSSGEIASLTVANTRRLFNLSEG